MQLTDGELDELSNSHSRLITWLMPYLPQLEPLIELCELPAHSTTQLKDLGPHFNTAIPGRKLSQIESFAAAVGRIDNPITEWCGGKGHLGRQLAANWDQPVTTLEYNAELCDAGEVLANKAKISQRFYKVDVLTTESGQYLPQQHAVALHACGDLHRTLIRQAVDVATPAIALSPCCYHLCKSDQYLPFTEQLKLKLNREELRLSVTETVTSATREVKWRDQEMAWKLGYGLLRRSLTETDQYQSMKPINKQWLRESFEQFCHHLAGREKTSIDLAQHSDIDWVDYEQQGWQRQREVMRLSLLRNAFRRPLEIWLILDISNYLIANGYDVELGQFCDREITPRNIIISARRG